MAGVNMYKNTTSMRRIQWFYLLLALMLGLGLGYWLFAGDPHQHEAIANSEGVSVSSTWTCSMHPQIRSAAAGACPICGMDLIPLEQNEQGADPTTFQMSATAAALARLQTTTVGAGSLEGSTLRLSGKIDADERLLRNQVMHFPGRIEQLLVKETGQRIRQGQLIARVYSPALITAQEELLSITRQRPLDSALYRAAVRKLQHWEIPQAQIEALLERGTVRSHWPVYADHAGTVTRRLLNQGDHAEAGSPLYELTGLEEVRALLEAYPDQLARLQAGQEVSIEVAAFAERRFKGRITLLEPQTDERTGVTQVRALLSNGEGLLRPGMPLQATVQTNAPSAAVLKVPVPAVLWTGSRSVVYRQISANPPAFQLVEVQLGTREGQRYTVLSGLEAGDEVVSRGAFTVDAAAQLGGNYSMMNPAREQIASVAASRLHDFRDKVSPGFARQLEGLLLGYLQLKDALVASDSTQASKLARRLQGQLAQAGSTGLQAEAKHYWLQERGALLALSAQLAGEAQLLEQQRQHFELLSDGFIKLISTFGNPSTTIYLQYCPMAFDFKGADWLSREEVIMNPYFGDQMLHCGSVEDVFEQK